MLRIRTRYLIVLVSLVAALTVAISAYHFVATQKLTDEFRERSLGRLEMALEQSARDHAVSLSALTAESLLEPLFFEDVAGVGNIVEPLLARDEVMLATVYTRDGKAFHNGSEKLETFGNVAPPEVRTLLDAPDGHIEMFDRATVRVIMPIVADGYVFGALDVLIDTRFVQQQISAMQSELIATTDREIRQQAVQLVISSLVALLIAGAVATFLANRLSAPIRELAEATRRISRGDFSVGIATRHNDELGELGEDFDRMAGTLRETMVSRSDLQRTVDEQTRELRAAHENLVSIENDRREVLEEIGEDLRTPMAELESDAEHALRNQDSAIELRHSMSRLLFRIRDVQRLLDDLRFASRSDTPRRAARRKDRA